MIVYYAITPDLAYMTQLLFSVTSLRRHNPALPVRAYVFGAATSDARHALAEAGVEVVECLPTRSDTFTMLKWDALPSIDYTEDVLYLDSDTAVYGDLRALAARYDGCDFAARVEVNIDDQIDAPAFARLADEVGAAVRPVYNTGVMLFRGGAHRELAAELPTMSALVARFAASPAAYPSTNRQLVDEVAAAIALGRRPALSCRAMTARDSPWYTERRRGLVPDGGYVTHVWSGLYAEFLTDPSMQAPT